MRVGLDAHRVAGYRDADACCPGHGGVALCRDHYAMAERALIAA